MRTRARVVSLAVAATLTAASSSTVSSCDTTSTTSESSVTTSDGTTTVHQRSSVTTGSHGSRSSYLVMVRMAWPSDVAKPSDDTLVSLGRAACDARASGASASTWTGAGDQSEVVFHAAAAFLC